MTTLADIRRIFSVRGLDPDRITQPPAPGEASFLFTTRLGGQVWFAPHEQDRQRIGWAYSADFECPAPAQQKFERLR